MAISSNVVVSYLPHLLDERQVSLSKKIVQLARQLRLEGLEVHLLDAAEKEPHIIGDPKAMQTAYDSAMASPGVTHDPIPKNHRTLSSLIKRYAREPGFHGLWSKVSLLLHTGEHKTLRELAMNDGFGSLLCKPCKAKKKCGVCDRGRLSESEAVSCGHEISKNMYQSCLSPVPAKIVHSVSLGFEYKPVTPLTRKALGVTGAGSGGVVVSSCLKYGPTSQLKRYDVITAVKTSNDGLCKLDEIGEHYKPTWGLSLSLSDIVERAPLGTEVSFQVHRGNKNMILRWTKMQQNKPSCRALDASEQHLNSSITLGGCTFKVLRMNDMMNPQIANSPAAMYAMNPHKRQLETVIVANVAPTSVAYHNYSLQPGHVVDEVNRVSLKKCKSPWYAFCQMLSDSSKSGVALLATESGGIDTIPVTQEEAATLTQYLQQLQ